MKVNNENDYSKSYDKSNDNRNKDTFFIVSNLVAKAPGLNLGKKISNLLATVRP